MPQQPPLAPQEERAIETVLQGWVLQAIAQSRKDFGKWVFHGGTALKKAFSSSRYSEDLDFMVEPTLDTVRLMEKVCAHLQTLVALTYGPTATLKLKARTSERNPQVYLLTLHAPELAMSSVKVKVEFSPTENLAAYIKTSVVATPDHAIVRNKVAHAPAVRVEVGDLNQLYLDKWVALTMRQEIKHRDVWDLSWLLDNRDLRPLNPTDIWEGMQTLVSRFYPKNDVSAQWYSQANQRANELNTPQYTRRFVDDMQRWLPPELASMPVSHFQERIDRVLALFEPLVACMKDTYGQAPTTTH